MGDEWKVPNIDELSAIFFNRRLFVFSGGHYWSSNKFSGTNLAWLQSRSSGSRYTYNIDSAFRLRCVKR